VTTLTASSVLGSRSAPRVFCVVVAYHPDIAALAALCAQLAREAAVLVVDNTEGPGVAPAALPSAAEVLTLGANTGIAHAQNVGIERALALGAGVVVLFDQDSVVGAGFVGALTHHLDPATAEVAAPRYVDDVHGFDLPSGRVGVLGWPRPVVPVAGTERYPVHIVIASGTAATRAAYAAAGLLNEGLFIDHVDTDWCLRCRARCVPIYVVAAVVMQHRLGSASRDLGIARVLVHSPARCYYQIRNSLLLFRRPYIPFLFAVRETIGIVLSRMLLLLFVANRLAYASAYLAAIRDGLTGVSGKRPE
jgi:rhamnosyltransferase